MTPAETAEDRDARLEKAALERDRAVALLRRIMADVDNTNLVYPTDEPDSLLDTREFLESLT